MAITECNNFILLYIISIILYDVYDVHDDDHRTDPVSNECAITLPDSNIMT